MKKRILICIAVSAILLSVVTVGVGANKDMRFFEFGKQAKENQSISSTEIVATVNGEGILRERFETYKEGLKLTSTQYTDREVLDKMIRREVLFQEIERLGITVTEEEVYAFNEERFAMMEADPTAYQITKDYVDGLGITMEEYKEMSLEISGESLLTTKYQEMLFTEFSVQAAQLESDAETAMEFEEYYNNRLDQLEQTAEIEILL